MSVLFGRTLREAPSGVEVASHGLLLRAGFIRQVAAGVFSYLPLAKRSIGKIEAILREEMEAVGGQEVSMPVVQPADVWERSGRYRTIGRELVHLVAAEVGEMADGLYEKLVSAGVEVLYDDRRESLGSRFKDADLMGIPLRLTLTPRSLQRGESRSKAEARQRVI